MDKKTLTQSHLKELLSYNPKTGIFRWIKRPPNSRKSGNVAGSKTLNGYVFIGINNKTYYAHRLAWLYVHGRFPEGDTDHINGVRNDNRIRNLRLATRTENNFNIGTRKHNKSGFKGVFWWKRSKKWLARATIKRRQFHLGLFSTPEEASVAYNDFAKKHHGEFLHV